MDSSSVRVVDSNDDDDDDGADVGGQPAELLSNLLWCGVVWCVFRLGLAWFVEFARELGQERFPEMTVRRWSLFPSLLLPPAAAILRAASSIDNVGEKGRRWWW